MAQGRAKKIFNHKKKLFIIFILVLISIIGFRFYEDFVQIWRRLYYSRYLDQSSLTTTKKTVFPDISMKQTDYQYLLVVTTLQNLPDEKNVTEYLNDNSIEMAKYIGNIYGVEAQTNFLKILNDQNLTFYEYLKAIKDDDLNVKGNVLSKWSSYPDEYAKFFVSVNPNIQSELVKMIYIDYLSTLKTIADAYKIKDYKTALRLKGVAQVQMNRISLSIVNMIEAQK